MSTQELNLFQLTTPILMSFPQLLEPQKVKRGGKETGEAKYSANFEFDTTDEAQAECLKALKSEMARVAKAKWPGVDLSTLKFPLSNGDKLADKAKAKTPPRDREWSRGKTVLVARSKFQPNTSVILNGKPVDLDEDTLKANKKAFYTGVMALAEVNIVAYDAIEDGDKAGITCYLQAVLSLNKGKRLTGSAKPASETFRGYIGTASAEDPTVGADDLDDEIPF